ncbi:MAG: flagellar biosynthesis protein FlhB [Methylomonas sp.]|nr:flagellar biosynthesis protein FlhB [Methylomonas sp.]MBS3965171.1 flagellar biosynthesis protein FlhB [Methylomonas sp.]PPD19368.1 MAG: flagellar biosynthesis protein FlhB [Methylomonas sp.]PPD24818.1 MAG: flagellar biosynthesis protein FlhB [Methylomonas sp.]PPD33603.1 MAG: flagellar biosynthesis protein FlhB [Methylomonas sp.]
MADDSGQDKTEAPSSKRLDDARRKGQVPRSRELNTFVTLIVSAAFFFFTGHQMTDGLMAMMKNQFQLDRQEIFDPATIIQHLQTALFDGLLVILPLMLVLLIVDLLTPVLMGGWNFSSEAYEPKFSKLNPLTGIKKIIGIQGLIELVKAIIKVILIGWVSWTVFMLHFDEFMGLSRLPLPQALQLMADVITLSLLIVSAAMLVLVAIDVPYQLWHHHEQLKMTKQDVRDEAKESEGSPEVKGRIRQLQMQASQRRMMEAVPKADVIVTNPTHFAVALQYSPEQAGAPILVAKGVDLMAAQIRNIALANKVTLVAAPGLARALYYSTELDHEIPRGLFLAVAQVLAYVFQLRAAVQNGWSKPVPPTDVAVPDEFRH